MFAVWRRYGEFALLILFVLVLLYAGLSPFELSRPNGVYWRSGVRGISFDGSGIVFSERPLEIEPGGGELTLEAWISLSETSLAREGTVFALMDEGEIVPVALNSRLSSLSLRYRISENGSIGSRAISLATALEAGRVQHVAVTTGPSGTRVYVDGVSPDRLRSRNALVDSGKGLRGRLVIGNSPQGVSGWVGSVLAVAIYARALPEKEVARHAELSVGDIGASLERDDELLGLYVFEPAGGEARGLRIPNRAQGKDPRIVAEHRVAPRLTSALFIPDRFEALRWDVLALPPAVSPLRSSRFRRDILLNLFGFVPLGVLLMLIIGERLRMRFSSFRRQFGVTCLAGAVLSLGIELGQALLPTRVSSVLDLGLNVVGTALGAGIVWLLRARLAGDKLADGASRPHSSDA